MNLPYELDGAGAALTRSVRDNFHPFGDECESVRNKTPKKVVSLR
jgi:hypothetical protein